MPLNRSCIASFDSLIEEIAKQMSTDDIIDTTNILTRREHANEQKQLTVQEFIEKLKQFPPDRKVCIVKDDAYFDNITVIDNITRINGELQQVVTIDCTPPRTDSWDDDEMDTPF